LDSAYKLVLPNGNRIFGSKRTLREKIDRFHESEKSTPAQTVQAGIFFRSEDEVDCIFDIDPSAFVHTVVDSESEQDEDERELESIKQALAFAKAKVDQKHNATSGVKAKNVHFDSVDVPSGARA
jgi:hypothetical protein